MASVGNIEDKIKVFKDELEVRGKARRKAIAGKRESLEKEIKNVKVSTVDYDELVDRKGNSLLDSCTKDAMSYWDLEVSKMFEGNNNRPKHRFGFGYRKTLNADQRATQPTELTDHMNKMASTTDQRRLEHDKSLVEDHVRQANIYINELRSQNLAKIDRTLNDGDKNYESIFIRETRLKGLKEKNQSACDEIERYIDAIPNKELSPSQIKQLKRSIDENRAEVLAEVKKATEEKKEVKTAYEMKVEEWAKEELKEKNPTEYELIKSGAKDPKDSQELEMLKVKHHVAESISAEVLCEQDEFGFSQFLAENTHLDPTSKEAKYAYYAQYKKDHNTTDMETLEQGELFSDRFDEIATDRINNDELNIHEEVEDKHIVAPEENIEVDEVVNEVSSEEPKAKEAEKDEQEAVEEVVEKSEETIVEPKSTVVPAENVNIDTTPYDAVEPVEETETEDIYVPLDEVGDEQIEENVDENADENVEDVYMTQEEEEELKRNAGEKPKRDKSNIVSRSKESKQSSKDNEETQGLTR